MALNLQGYTWLMENLFCHSFCSGEKKDLSYLFGTCWTSDGWALAEAAALRMLMQELELLLDSGWQCHAEHFTAAVVTPCLWISCWKAGSCSHLKPNCPDIYSGAYLFLMYNLPPRREVLRSTNREGPFIYFLKLSAAVQTDIENFCLCIYSFALFFTVGPKILW